MRKKGFTLAETLVTLSVVGIAVALLAPSLRNIIPNKHKMEFSECYKQLTYALPLIHDYYEVEYKSTTGVGIPGTTITLSQLKLYPICHGLGCLNTGDGGCSGNGKIGCLINKLVGNEKYSWEGSTTTGEKENKNITHDIPYAQTYLRSLYPIKYAKSHEVTCTAPSKKTYTFILNGNGTIRKVKGEESKYMNDQFNYYKKD